MPLAHSQSIGNDKGERTTQGNQVEQGRSNDNPPEPSLNLSSESPLPPMASDATVSPNVGVPSTPEISAPMLEVHAPHLSIHTRKDFFIRGREGASRSAVQRAGPMVTRIADEEKIAQVSCQAGREI
jgi:hypothetical protein